jgi:riboflavin synthase
MFTGIIEEIGRVSDIQSTPEHFKMKINAGKVLSGTAVGDSIAVNGICLTVTAIHHNAFTVDVMPETLKATTLGAIRPGTPVNLERAMAANGRFGGHFVTGHVDGIGKIMRKTPISNAVNVLIEADHELLKYMVLKGSIAVDGTSLTIFGVHERSFTISLIPHTLEKTVLGLKGVGDFVNLECDLLAKYLEKYATQNNHPTLSPAFLKKHGYL